MELGMPIKIKAGYDQQENAVYYYGRYYGKGIDEDDESSHSGAIVVAITPGNSIVRSGFAHVDKLVSIEDIKKLKYWEDNEIKNGDTPYSLFFNQDSDGKFYKNNEFLNHATNFFEYYDVNYYDNKGYFQIDSKLFGQGLSKILTEQTGISYEWHSKFLVISIPMKYSSHEIDHKAEIQFISSRNVSQNDNYNKYIIDDSESFWINQNKCRERIKIANPFIATNTELDKNDMLINCSNFIYSSCNKTICLGKLDNERNFIPNNFFLIKTNLTDNFSKIAQNFAQSIIDYKLENRKPVIVGEDIDIIVENFKNRQSTNLTDKTKLTRQ